MFTDAGGFQLLLGNTIAEIGARKRVRLRLLFLSPLLSRTTMKIYVHPGALGGARATNCPPVHSCTMLLLVLIDR